MVLPLIELVGDILEKRKFDKCKVDEKKLKKEIGRLFSLHREQQDQFSARQVYSAIVDLARLGKGGIATEFALKFEKEIGSDKLV